MLNMIMDKVTKVMESYCFIFVMLVILLPEIGIMAFGAVDKCEGDVCDTEPEEQRYTAESNQALPPCPHPPPGLGPYNVEEQVVQLDIIESHITNVQPGGTWKPTHCRAHQKLAILIPYRGRETDFLRFFNNIHQFLQKQLLDYRIFIVEQADDKHFNRASLINVGYLVSKDLESFDCLVLHDIDKYPEDSRNMYTCTDHPHHLLGRYRNFGKDWKKRPYEEYFSGVLNLPMTDYDKLNGMSNRFWGWGSEDDDFMSRMKFHELKRTRSPEDIGGFVEGTTSQYDFVNPRRHQVNNEGKDKFLTDGLNNMKEGVNYQIKAITKEKLYTNIAVVLLNEDPYYGKDEELKRKKKK